MFRSVVRTDEMFSISKCDPMSPGAPAERRPRPSRLSGRPLGRIGRAIGGSRGPRVPRAARHAAAGGDSAAAEDDSVLTRHGARGQEQSALFQRRFAALSAPSGANLRWVLAWWEAVLCRSLSLGPRSPGAGARAREAGWRRGWTPGRRQVVAVGQDARDSLAKAHGAVPPTARRVRSALEEAEGGGSGFTTTRPGGTGSGGGA